MLNGNSINEISGIVSPIAARYGAERVFLFGSFARGDMTDSSDVDLRIDKGKIWGTQIAGLLLELEQALGREVDLIPTTSLDRKFLNAIQKDEVLIFSAAQ